MWNVVFCRNCSQECDDDLPCSVHDVRLYGYRRVKNVDKGNRYYCKQCGFSTGLEFLERYVEWRILHEAGRNPQMEPITIRGSDHSGEIIKLERRIERLRSELDLEYDEDLERSIRKAEEKVESLLQGPHEPDRVILQPVTPPTTVAEHWASLKTSKEKNDYLRSTVTTFYADKEGIIGQPGWMALDDPSVSYAGLKRYLRRLKMPYMETWDKASERMAH